MIKKKSVLYIEKDIDAILRAKTYIKECGFELDYAGQSLKALKLIISKPFDIIFLNTSMPYINVEALIAKVRTSLPSALLIGIGSPEDIVETYRSLVDEFIGAPIEANSFKSFLRSVA